MAKFIRPLGNTIKQSRCTRSNHHRPSQAGKWHWTIGGIYEDTTFQIGDPSLSPIWRSTPRHTSKWPCHRNLNEFTEALTLYLRPWPRRHRARRHAAIGTPTRSRRTKECNQMVSKKLQAVPRSPYKYACPPPRIRKQRHTWRVERKVLTSRALAPNSFPPLAQIAW